MEAHIHDLTSLFDQLGLPSEPAAIDRFIAGHRPLPPGVLTHEAPFWTPAQAAFLQESMLQDSDWAEIVDTLNEELHKPVTLFGR